MLTREEEQYREAVRRYYQAYNQLKKTMNVRERSHFDIYGNNYIKIYEYQGEKSVRLVVKAEEDDDTLCYQRATELIESMIKK